MIITAQKNKPSITFFLLISVMILVLSMSSDILYSTVRTSSYYISESFLFGLFWPLFVPFILAMRLLSRPPYQVPGPLTVIGACLFHPLLFALVVYTVSAIGYDHSFDFTKVFTKYLVDKSFICIIAYTTAMLLFRSPVVKPEKPVSPKRICVNHRNANILVYCSDIYYIRTERPYLALVTNEHTYLYSSSLAAFQKEYLSEEFIRVHRSTIINVNHIHSFTSRKNGDYDVVMANGDTLRVSRNYNNFFRSPQSTA